MDLKQFILALGTHRKAFLIALIATIVTTITVRAGACQDARPATA